MIALVLYGVGILAFTGLVAWFNRAADEMDRVPLLGVLVLPWFWPAFVVAVTGIWVQLVVGQFFRRRNTTV